MTGSWAYVRAHRDELDRARAAILFEAAADPAQRITCSTAGTTSKPGVREAMKPIESMERYQFHALMRRFDADSFDFLLEGVPTVVAIQCEAILLPKSARTVSELARQDQIFEELKRNTAIAAVTAFGIAERAEPIGPRQSRAEIESLLKTTGLDEQMKTAGLWPLWESGERGRLP